MAHREQREFVEGIRVLFPEAFRGTRVLEVGSLNVNGSIREFFTGCDYVGLDCHPGKDVDVVCVAHQFSAPPFDVVCSCECFEHDPHAHKTVQNMLRLLKPGGLFFATAAGEGRPEHGTSGTRRDGHEPFGPEPDFYRNVTVRDMLYWLDGPSKLTRVLVEHDKRNCDLFCCAIKSMSP